MSTKKNIDRLFQEKFKDFEATPNEEVWNRISESLPKKKKKRRVIALWWQVGGVAAAIVLLFFIGKSVIDSSDGSIQQPTIVDTKNNNELKDKYNGSSPEKQSSNKLIDEPQQESTKYVEGTKGDVEETTNDVQERNRNENKAKVNKLTAPNVSQLNNNAVANASNSKEEKTLPSTEEHKRLKTLISTNKKDVKVANTNPYEDNKSEIKDESSVKSLIKESIKNNESAVVDNTSTENYSSNSESSNSNESDTNANTLNDKETSNISEDSEALLNENGKEDIKDALAAQDNTDEKEKEDDNLSRWSIAPNVAPVYFSSLGQGSPIDGQFTNNSKSSDINMSYGIAGTYAVSDKLKIRAGVNRVNLSQTTSNVFAFSSSEFASRFNGDEAVANRNINNEGNVILMSANAMNPNTTPEVFNTKTAGKIDQRFGFIEVPLEVEYRLLNKKFGVNVIGGFSTFFLNQNEIYADIDGTPTLVGEAKNINSTSFSANFGLGLDYKLSKQWNINLEPQFKYQLNTFNNISGNFRPFFIGVYTGLNFKF